jgi:hypothetical protein
MITFASASVVRISRLRTSSRRPDLLHPNRTDGVYDRAFLIATMRSHVGSCHVSERVTRIKPERCIKCTRRAVEVSGSLEVDAKIIRPSAEGYVLGKASVVVALDHLLQQRSIDRTTMSLVGKQRALSKQAAASEAE